MGPAEPIKDFIILGVPAGVDPTDPAMEIQLEDEMCAQLIAQYRAKGSKPPRYLGIVSVEWLFTSDPEAVERFQPGDGCPKCIAGNDQAVAFLREHPDRKLALGNVVYTEHW